jgi:thiol-disulfide isomerase/thioredoxin
MTKVKVILFHAKWCGHCLKFQPNWEKLKKNITNKNIEFIDYEDKLIEELNDDEKKINGNKIAGFPTIKIIVSDDKNNKIKEYEYAKKRDYDVLKTDIENNLN